jgi:hypothetical protein
MNGHLSNSVKQSFRVVSWCLTALIGASFVTGCYVVPVHPSQLPPGYPAQQAAVSQYPAPVVPVSFPARLYPANDQASAYGVISAIVTSDLQGRGTFSTNINGENFSGEATRVSGSQRTGIANGAGNRGNFINCQYQMNSTTVGTGTCKLSNGAQFSMHVGS